MNENDSLSRLFKTWQPKSPHLPEPFVQETVRRIRQSKSEPFWKRLANRWSETLSEWLPSPNMAIPVAASLIIFLGALQWNAGVHEAKTLAALQWHEELSQPLAKVSLTGTYAQLAQQ